MAESIKGMNKLIRKLNSLAELKAAKRGLKAGAVHIEGKMRQYPAESGANKSRAFVSGGNNRWYERGFGPRWVRKDGTWGGKKTSKVLSKQWTIDERMNGLQWVVGNNVSYAPFVQSYEKQAHFHKERGWITDEQVLKDEGKTVLEFVKKEVDKELRK
jgi:hypothetical protein